TDLNLLRKVKYALMLSLVFLALFVSAETATIVHASPILTLNTTTGQTGIVVAVSGSGFVSGDAGIGIPCLTGSVVTGAPQLCTFSATGIMSSSFTVADVPVGPYSVQAAGTTGDSMSTTFTVVSHPSIVLSLNSGPIGATVSVTGSGFAPSDS